MRIKCILIKRAFGVVPSLNQDVLQVEASAGEYKVGIHSAVSVGELQFVVLGEQTEKDQPSAHVFVATGKAYTEACDALELTKTGEIAIPTASWALVRPYAEGSGLVGVDQGPMGDYAEGLTFISGPLAHKGPLQKTRLPLRKTGSPASMMPYLGDHEVKRAGQSAELRTVTILFVKMPNEVYKDMDANDMDAANEVFKEVHAAVCSVKGDVQKLIFDDKGCLFIAACGTSQSQGLEMDATPALTLTLRVGHLKFS